MDPECRDVQMRMAGLRPSDPLAPGVEAHLTRCQLCQAAWRADRELWDALGDYSAPAAPAAFLERVQAKLANPADELARRRKRDPSRARPVTLQFVAAAAAMVLLGAGLGSFIGARHANRSDASAPPASAAVAEDAALFSVDAPGSLSRAYASLEAYGGRR